MDRILKSELESGMGSAAGTYTAEEQEEIERRFSEMHELMTWLKEKYHSIPPRFSSIFNSLSCEVLKSAGYTIKLDPGEMPS